MWVIIVFVLILSQKPAWKYLHISPTELRGVVNENRSMRDRAERMMRDYIKQTHNFATLSHFLNPIDPMYRISTIK